MQAIKRFALVFACCVVLPASPAWSQELGPRFTTVREGIHVYAAKPIDSNCTIILTQDGVVLIDSGHNPPDSRAVMQAVRQLTPHPDDWVGRDRYANNIEAAWRAVTEN